MADEIKYGKKEDFAICDEWYHLIPPVAKEDEQTLRQDILENGIRVPLEVTKDLVLVDGHQRHRILRQNPDAPQVVPYRVLDIAEEEIPKHIFAVNFQRRQLSRFNRAKIAVETAEKWGWFKESEERMKSGKPADPMEKSPEGTTHERIEKFFGVTEYYVRAAIRLRKSPEGNLLTACVDGTIKVSKALDTLDKKEKRQENPAVKSGTDNLSWYIEYTNPEVFRKHMSKIIPRLWLPDKADGITITGKLKKRPKEKDHASERPWNPKPFQGVACDHGVVGGCRKCFRDPDNAEHGKKTAIRKQDKVEVPIDRAEMGGFRILPDKDLKPCRNCDHSPDGGDTCTIILGADDIPDHCRKWRKIA
jgi:hypothetical protein